MKKLIHLTKYNRKVQSCFWLPMLILLFSGNVWGGECLDGHDVRFDKVTANCSNDEEVCTYAFQDGIALDPDTDPERIGITPLPDPTAAITWTYSSISGACNPNEPKCLGGVVIFDDDGPDNDQPLDLKTNEAEITLSGVATGPTDGSATGCFQLTADVAGGGSGSRQYKFHITAKGGGWGDVHIKTVDGVPYDFQSVGEFILLKGDGIEIQTRQSAVSKQNASVHRYDREDTGIRNCVSIYTAVAALVGNHKVTIQPNPNGNADDTDPQIRVNGELKAVGQDGIDLTECDCDSDPVSKKISGRIIRAADEKSIEIRYANGTRLVVVPRWWGGAQQRQFFNVDVYDTTASKGIMGRIADGSWLPALFDGTNVGPMGGTAQEKYDQLYVEFADSWRVGGEDKPSFFYYEGTNDTITYTMEDWPMHNPANCRVDNKPIADPVDVAVAEEACAEVVDEINRENCIFDVSETGFTGFADAYERSEQLIPGATRTTLVANKNKSKSGEGVTFTATVMRTVSTIGKITSGKIQFVLDGSNVGDPIEFDTDGNAVWSTSNLSNGSHVIEARYLPSGFGEQFRASNSPKVSHNVSMLGKLSLHLGVNIPHGSLGDGIDGDTGFAFDYEYPWSDSYSLLVFAGKNEFDNDGEEIDINNLSINGKHYYGRSAESRYRYFSNAGIGIYSADPGDDDLGLNVGGGVQYPLAARYGLELWYNYHHIISSPDSSDFSTVQFGGYYHF